MSRTKALKLYFYLISVFALTALGLFAPAPVLADNQSFKLGATTSAYDTGLLPLLRREFRKDTGIDIKMVIKGTGRVLDIARRGDVDALLVHDPQSELDFIAGGYAEERHRIMYNDFVIVGPKSDPAGIRGETAVQALSGLAQFKHPFTSRGDRSGTHKAELRLWKAAALDPAKAAKDLGAGSRWYKSLGSGMGATLNTASALNAYCLTDRGTWLAFENKLNLEILVRDDPALRNVYSFLAVSPKRFPHINAPAAQAFLNWLHTGRAQGLIGSFRKGGQQLFYPLNPAH